ncbi:hypothetical protein [Proteus mirabilis]|uniref:hypothetical protein n=1 Tax=Proteus mirabilis TaxID=584 RepID=UPI0034D613F1
MGSFGYCSPVNSETAVSYKNAVKVCQLQLKLNEKLNTNLVIDGHFGESTLGALNILAQALTNSPVVMDFKYHRAASVEAIQRWHNKVASRLGIGFIDIDNDWGAGTENAINLLFDTGIAKLDKII